MSFSSMDAFREDIVNIIEQTIAARENHILKSLFQFQDNVMQELLSLKLLLYKHCASSMTSDMDILNHASSKIKNTTLTGLARDTNIFEDSLKKRDNAKSSSNESEDETKYVAPDWSISQVFQKDSQKESERSGRTTMHPNSLASMYSEPYNLSSSSKIFNAIGIHPRQVSSPVTDLNEDEEMGQCSNSATEFPSEDAVGPLFDGPGAPTDKVKISPENIKEFYVQLSDKAPSDEEISNVNHTAMVPYISRPDSFVLNNPAVDRYRCSYCDVMFDDSGMLEAHLATHLRKKEKKRCKCLICGTICSSKSTMHKHLRRHNGDKPFECRICGRAFNLKYSLKRHLMTHTGEKPFKCTVCNKAFSRKDRRDVHARANHPDLFFAANALSRSEGGTEGHALTPMQ